MNERKIWQVRLVKEHGGDDGLVLVGRVLRRDDVSVKFHSKSFNIPGDVRRLRDVGVGPLATRIVPWHRVEVIHELPPDFDFARATLAIDHEGNYALFDGFSSCVVLSQRERLLAAGRLPAVSAV